LLIFKRALNVLLIFLITGCSQAQNNSTDGLFVDHLAFKNVSIVDHVDTVAGQPYYRYISQSKIIGLFGNPDKKIRRVDELMETTIVRLIYGKSYLDFYDHTYNDDINEDEFSLLALQFSGPELSLKYNDGVISVGESIPDVFNLDQNKEQHLLSLNRKILNQKSEYFLRIELENDKVTELGATFD